MAVPTPVPMYPVYQELKQIEIATHQEVVDNKIITREELPDFPSLSRFLNDGPAWRMQHWRWGLEFLQYTGRNKSEHTYARFRNEIERFLLWAFLFNEKPIEQFRKSDILDYADFCWSPPVEWIALHNYEKFTLKQGYLEPNPDWAPFRIVLPKGDKSEPDRRKYRPSQQSMVSMFTSITAFYRYLMEEEYLYGNPAQVAKKDCRHIIKDAQVKDVKRLSEQHWQFMLDVATEMADEDPIYERNLFLVAALKALFLRISELSERPNWNPEMGHFWEDSDGNWWLKVFGKGRKVRDITVPESFLPYLKRYRLYRGLPALPETREYQPIIEKIRGQGGMTARQLSRLVQQVFDKSYEKMVSQYGEMKARQFKEASSHWLRHTGASMEIERGRPLKDLSEDLGHASMGTTDTIYVQSEDKKRAASGKRREVK